MTPSQKWAINPKINAWVSASAGTGKTKVLIDRLLTLLLQGTPFDHILCLTFTKAAAFEMKTRLLSSLLKLASEGNEKAQDIYEKLLEAPDRLKIQTLHSFCQRVISQFPYEAGIQAFSTLLDEDQAIKLLQESLSIVFKKASDEIFDAIECLSVYLGEVNFERCLIDAFSKWHRLRHLEKSYPTAQDFKNKLEECFSFEVPYEPIEDFDEKEICEALETSSAPMDKKLKESLSRIQEIDVFSLFLTKEGEVRKKIVSAAFERAFPELTEALFQYAQSLFLKRQKNLYDEWLKANKYFWLIVQDVLKVYAQLKEQKGFIDYHDLILHTLALFQDGPLQLWVQSRLDYTIDHILVDEAQDNSPEQWLLIYHLVNTFIREDTPYRSFFVVGDLKQSIYGFQGAAPHLFKNLPETFQQLLTSRRHSFERISLDQSFRTLPSILNVVDTVFSAQDQGIFDYKSHIAYRCEAKGWVHVTEPKINQVHTNDEDLKNEKSWSFPFENAHQEEESFEEALCEKIQWLLNQKWVLPSTQQIIKPSDILILLRSRGEQAPAIVRALKHKHIPVVGLDRFYLQERQAIQDLMSLLRFLSLPQDDYALACVLKSPLVNQGLGMSEEELFELSYQRSSSLWNSLRSHIKYQKVAEGLRSWLKQVDYMKTSELLTKVWYETRHMFMNRLGPDCDMLFEAFMDYIFNLENQYSSLQEILTELESNPITIKREEDLSINGVRIMTIHGSKGLQAPVVIVVDNDHRVDLSKESLLWLEEHDCLCLRPRSSLKVESINLIKNEVKQSLKEEDNRLLYVALTRAQDILVIFGEGEWRNRVQQAQKYEEPDFKTKYEDEILNIKLTHEKPEWLSDSSLIQTKQDDSMASPQEEKSLHSNAQERGILLHTFFEHIQNKPKNEWKNIFNLLNKDNLLSEEDWHHLEKLFNNSLWSEIWNAKALVESTFFIEGKCYRFDRLIFKNNEIWIVDYKTGKITSNEYKEQLHAYNKSLKIIFPDFLIRTFLLWTETMHLEEVI